MIADSKQQASRRAVICLLTLQAAALLVIGAHVLVTEMVLGRQLDMAHYYQVAGDMLAGKVPYRDFALEYPPFAVTAFLLPRLLVGGGQAEFTPYLWAFLFQSILLSTLIGGLLWRMTTRWRFPMTSETALAAYAALVAVGAYLLPWRFDIFPALLTALALYSLLAGRSLAAGVWLGLGIAAKMYPLVLLPVFALYLASQGRRRESGRLLAGSFGTVAFCLLPFLLLCPGSLLSFVKYHEMRGLEIGSWGAGVILLARQWGLTSGAIVFNYGAFHVASPWASSIIACLPFGFLALLGLLLVQCGRCFRQEYRAGGVVSPASLARYATAALLLFLVANKVFSPQYVFWLLPFVPLLRPREAAGLVAVSMLTALIYPTDFAHLLRLEPGAVLLLNARNLLAALLLGGLLLPRKATDA